MTDTELSSMNPTSLVMKRESDLQQGQIHMLQALKAALHNPLYLAAILCKGHTNIALIGKPHNGGEELLQTKRACLAERGVDIAV